VNVTDLAPPLTEQAADIDRVWNGFLAGAVAVAAGVAVTLLFVVVRYRRRSSALPRQRRENIPVEITYTVVPLLVVIGLFAVTFASVQALEEVDDDPDLTVEVVGFQWQWQFTYPDSGVRVIGSDGELPELVLPTGARVQFDLTSVDVIHSFWIPGFRYKRDLFPGQTQVFQVDVGDTPGDYPNSGVCAEFCGLDHDAMRFSVRIVTPDEFDAWLQQRSEEATT
jgi:cytochrome c oxidase subunit 2